MTTTTETEFSQQFEFAVWKLTERGERKPMEQLLARLEDTKTGRQITEAKRLLNGATTEEKTS